MWVTVTPGTWASRVRNTADMSSTLRRRWVRSTSRT